MSKRLVGLLLSVVLLLTSVVAVSAADTSLNNTFADATVDNNFIYFDTTGWKNFYSISCHIWVRGGESFFSFGSQKELCNKVTDTKYSFDLSSLNKSTNISGGLKPGVDYCIIFYANSNAPQTYDMTFGTDCIGDTAKMTGKIVENPVDSERSSYEAVWTKNSSKYGPHFAITSTGNIIGSKFCPNEKGYEVVGDWLATYYDHRNFDVAATLKKALKKFNADAGEVYSYIKSLKTLSSSELSAIKTLLNDSGIYKATINTKKKSLKAGKTFNIKVETNSSVKIKYNSSNPLVAKVSSKGKVTALSEGKAIIKAKLGQTGLSCKITVTNDPELSKTYVEVKKGKTATVKIKGKAKGINNKYTKTSIAKITSKKSASKIKVKGLKKGFTYLEVTVNYRRLLLFVRVK